jgi:trimeric autotransporter adhesin
MRKNFNKLLVCALLMITVSAHAQTYFITTVAGNGATSPFGPDNIQATTSHLNSPCGVATDDLGDFYIADKTNQRIRKVSKTGIITTVAGNGTPGYTGDGFAATAATLNSPTGVAKDKYGNIYIADNNNTVIRKVSAAGIITTLAGPGTATVLGDGGPATAAYLSSPVDVAVDTFGNVFIADQGNARIREVYATSGTITTVAGTTSAGYNMDGIAATLAQLNIPSAVCVDVYGNIFIADENNYRIREVTATTGMISTVAGTGVGGYSGNGDLAASALISYSYGVAVDRSGNLFISTNDEIRKIDGTTGIISLYAGIYGISAFGGDGGLADTSKLNTAQGLAVDTTGNLYIADESNNRIRKVYALNTTAVQQLASQNSSITLYPDPNSGTFTIKGSLNTILDQKVSLSVTNMLGQVVYENSLVVHNGVLNTRVSLQSSLPQGLYLLNIISGTQNELTKFVIQR